MNRRSFFEMLGVAAVALGLSKTASGQTAARAALGANALPLNAAVEIESVWEIRN